MCQCFFIQILYIGVELVVIIQDNSELVAAKSHLAMKKQSLHVQVKRVETKVRDLTYLYT